MSRINIDRDIEDRIFAIFDQAHNAQLRMMRALSRGFINVHAAREVVGHAQSILRDAEALVEATELAEDVK